MAGVNGGSPMSGPMMATHNRQAFGARPLSAANELTIWMRGGRLEGEKGPGRLESASGPPSACLRRVWTGWLVTNCSLCADHPTGFAEAPCLQGATGCHRVQGGNVDGAPFSKARHRHALSPVSST